jgi:hypothetical protein
VKKEEILAQSRQAKKDEGAEFAESKGNRLGIGIMGVALVFTLFFSLYTVEFAAMWAVIFVSGAFFLGQYFSLYRFTKKKSYFVLSIVGVVSVIISLMQFIALSLGWCAWWIFEFCELCI